MERYTRRRALQLGVGGLGVLAGCSTTSPGSDETTSDGLALDTLSVAGSSGSTVPVQPSNSVVLLDFFATWCAPCKPQMKHLRQIRSDFPDLHMLSVTWESERSLVADFWREYEGTWNVAMDPELRTGERYGIDRIPTLVVLDADGTEQWRHTGLVAADDVAERLRAAGASGGG
ncbi:TlpA disulfide reductase family protein [Haloarculaceae archaeon H-GB2-1]|nr:TlpA disulfide reductase family protein [Haloarculaceae archaeon H-GB1-1]MEA5386368.1 TlpA disulfide reductase family protein [Haloarculaceae archaeon H-GB11]MEA5407874.1 TlpA disulfide reductase family protein [Haloarculaceae archaeon H-GB2-1]